MLAFNGLIGVGVAADVDDPGRIPGRRQLLFKQGCGVRLEEQPALEIQPRRQAKKGVGRAGVAIDAAELNTKSSCP